MKFFSTLVRKYSVVAQSKTKITAGKEFIHETGLKSSGDIDAAIEGYDEQPESSKTKFAPKIFANEEEAVNYLENESNNFSGIVVASYYESEFINEESKNKYKKEIDSNKKLLAKKEKLKDQFEKLVDTIYPLWMKVIELRKKMVLDLTGDDAEKRHDCTNCGCAIKGLEIALSKNNYHSRIKRNEHDALLDTKFNTAKDRLRSAIIDWARHSNKPFSSAPFNVYCPVCEESIDTKKYASLLKADMKNLSSLSDKAKELLSALWTSEKERKEIDPKYLKKVEKWAFAYWGRF